MCSECPASAKDLILAYAEVGFSIEIATRLARDSVIQATLEEVSDPITLRGELLTRSEIVNAAGAELQAERWGQIRVAEILAEEEW
jgi:hypothetical protein